MRLPTFKRKGHLSTVLAVIFLLSMNPSRVDADDGQALFNQKCVSCHAVSQTSKVPIKDRASIKGMPLWFAGSKFKQVWLETWLASPQPIFGVKWGTLDKGASEHPAVDPSEAAALTGYLMTLIDAQVKVDSTEPLPKSRGKRKSFLGRARQLFEKHQGCYACHRYLNHRRQQLGGFSGPSLVDAEKRLNTDWVNAFLNNPGRYYPNGTCSIPGDSAFNKFTEENRSALATYITNMGVR